MRYNNSSMDIRFATESELATWNNLINLNPSGGNILQGKEFIEQKLTGGWTARYIVSDHCAFSVIEKQIPLLGKVWYCPKGPGVATKQQLADLLPALTSFAKKLGVFTVKIEPELDHTTDLSDLRLIPTTPVQYNYSTVYIDLSPSLEKIMANLNQKGRHAIRRAERDGVTVKAVPATNENCQIMYNLFRETAHGAGFAIRPPEYYQSFYTVYESQGRGQLFFAYYEDKVVAGAYAMVQGQNSMYKDGASVRERTAYGASHLLQWHVMQWAKQNGSVKHDLAGVPPIKDIKNPNHPFSGLARFKTSFNKQVTQYVGAFEVPVIYWKAKLWQRYVEKLVRRFYFKLKHESYY
jgi:peptidoglycan pentaglycine glycine transferase (the first glycine)